MDKFTLLIILALSLLLAGCGVVQANQPTPTSAGTETGPVLDESLSRTDEQGAISVTVTPLNFEAPGKTLDFEVVLDTHSVDLGMDLALLAKLATNAGLSAPASKWEAPRGGHHVQGTLVFPSTVDGKALLDGASRLTLTIKDLDGIERVFSWEISG